MIFKKINKIPCYSFADYKLYIVLALSILTVYNYFDLGIKVLYQVLTAIVVGGVVDGIIIKFRSRKWYFPSGAIISAMIVALILPIGDYKNLIIVVLLSLMLKHLINFRKRNVFNPAVLAIVVSSFFLPIFSSWWGSSGILTFILGLLLVVLIKRWDIALSFFVLYNVLFSLKLFFAGSFSFSLGILSGPIAFFAFFMLIEPVTTPKSIKGKVFFGLLVGLLAFGLTYVPSFLGNSYFLYISLLIGNLLMRVFPNHFLE
jgi:enediyne biosynthesis protein E5